MRLWTVHPCYLDCRGLVAEWREGLLAQKVLAGGTKGYRNHPQLVRFKASGDAMGAIGSFLEGVWEEARRRGYGFDRSKIVAARFVGQIEEARGQVGFEWEHLLAKLKVRDAGRFEMCCGETGEVRVHSLFRVVEGGVREWEKGGG